MRLCNFSTITSLLVNILKMCGLLCGSSLEYVKEGGHREKIMKNKVKQCSLCTGQEEPHWPLWHAGSRSQGL